MVAGFVLLAVCLGAATGQLLGGETTVASVESSDVQGAAAAAVSRLNQRNPSTSPELILYRTTSGTLQVVRGIRYRLIVEVAPALACLNDHVPSTIEECPVDTNQISSWAVDVVSFSGSYDILGLTSVDSSFGRGPPGGKNEIKNVSDSHVVGAACAAVAEITTMSNCIHKTVLVKTVNGTYQVVKGVIYVLLIEVGRSTTCLRNSTKCTSEECPIAEGSIALWNATVLAPPGVPPTYEVQKVFPVKTGGLAATLDDMGGGAVAKAVTGWLVFLALAMMFM